MAVDQRGRLAITGASGQLGTALRTRLGQSALGWTRAQCDLADPKSIRNAVDGHRPKVVINCAAFTAVDSAEDEVEACHRINVLAVAELAAVCNDVGAMLVQVSTDYVFGDATSTSGPNCETSPTHAQGVYAASKLAGESMAQRCDRHLIVRTCGIYGHLPQPKNFVETMLRLGATRDQLTVVDDQHCNPTSAATVAQAILALIDGEHQGTYHVAAGPAVTWCEFAKKIFSQAGMSTRVAPITTEQFGAKAARPRFSVLDTGKYTASTGLALPSIDDDLAAYLAARTRPFFVSKFLSSRDTML